MTTLHPIVTWAQRSSDSDATKNIVYLTIAIQDATNVDIQLTSDRLKFSGESAEDKKQYVLDLEFFKPIDVDESKRSDSGNKIFFILRKKELETDYWPRLTKEKLKLHYIKTDFDKWVDEDEQDEQPEEADDMANMMNMGGAGGMPGMPGMGGMPGMPGMGGMGGMPGMGAMGGMPGMGGDGAGGLDFSKLMQSIGGGGEGGPDLSQLASQLGQAGAGDDDEEGDDEEDIEEISTK